MPEFASIEITNKQIWILGMALLLIPTDWKENKLFPILWADPKVYFEVI